jgi:hypothetical protein
MALIEKGTYALIGLSLIFWLRFYLLAVQLLWPVSTSNWKVEMPLLAILLAVVVFARFRRAWLSRFGFWTLVGFGVVTLLPYVLARSSEALYALESCIALTPYVLGAVVTLSCLPEAKWGPRARQPFLYVLGFLTYKLYILPIINGLFLAAMLRIHSAEIDFPIDLSRFMLRTLNPYSYLFTAWPMLLLAGFIGLCSYLRNDSGSNSAPHPASTSSP